MARQDFSFAFALCLSVLLHTLLLGTAAELYSIRAPGGRSALARLFKLEPPPPLPSPHEDDVDERDPTQRIGDSTGGGIAIMEAPGDLPLQAPKASQDQPFLSRDPVGHGKVGDDPTESILPLGKSSESTAEQVAAAMPMARPPTPAIPETPAYLGATNSQPDFAAPFKPAPRPKETVQAPPEPGPGLPPSPQQEKQQDQSNPETKSAPEQPETKPTQPPREQKPSPSTPPTPPVPPQIAMATPKAPSGDASAQPGASSSADPAPMADSEIDPVSTIGTAEFSAGATRVRLGRKTKLTRPRLSLGARTDMMTMPTAAVLLRIKIDSTGKVISAEIARSSGNPAVDQPCKLAAYNWWFEPLKDNLGRPTKDVIMFAIRFI